MIKRLLGTAICTAVGMAPLAASAADGYFGGGLGYAQYENEELVQNGDLTLEDDRMTWQLYGGFKFVPQFGLEANYVDFDEAADSGVTLGADGFGVALAGHLPVTDMFTLSARVGQFWWNADVDFDDSANRVDYSDSGNDMFWGIDARFGRSEGLAFALKYDRYELEGTDINMPSLNLEVGF